MLVAAARLQQIAAAKSGASGYLARSVGGFSLSLGKVADEEFRVDERQSAH